MKKSLMIFYVLGAWTGVLAGDLDQDGIEDSKDACPRTPANVAVDDAGRPWGDFDLDCDVDLLDMARILKSFTGALANEPVNECSQNLQACDTSTSVCADTEYGYTCECFDGQSDCDEAPGCEVVHWQSPNFCHNATDLGSFCGDICQWLPENPERFVEVARESGRTSAWFKVTAEGCLFCSKFTPFLLLRFNLYLPECADYDLIVWDACGSMHAESRHGGSVDAFAGSGDNGEWWIEVRYVGGASCDPWILTVERAE